MRGPSTNTQARELSGLKRAAEFHQACACVVVNVAEKEKRSVEELLLDYADLPAQERGAVDFHLTQCLLGARTYSEFKS